MKTPTFRDVELLSTYLDGKLSQADSARLESRLKEDLNLRTVMDDLAQSRSLLRKLPKRRAPRNFTLTPQMARVKPPLPRAVPALRWATSLATLLLVVTFAANAFVPAQPVLGRGGGGGGGDAPLMESSPALDATEAPATEVPAATESPAMAPAPTEPTVMETEMSLNEPQPTAEVLPTPDSYLKDSNPEQSLEPAQDQRAPLSASVAWQIGLLAIAVACGGMAWILSAISDQSWRRKVK
jgi:hypothetical protein